MSSHFLAINYWRCTDRFLPFQLTRDYFCRNIFIIMHFTSNRHSFYSPYENFKKMKSKNKNKNFSLWQNFQSRRNPLLAQLCIAHWLLVREKETCVFQLTPWRRSREFKKKGWGAKVTFLCLPRYQKKCIFNFYLTEEEGKLSIVIP